MTTGRGREAKIRPEFQGLYPGLQAAEWEPVENILQRVAELSQDDPTKDGGIKTNSRPLQDEHFEFRGASSRPGGSAPRFSRATDRDRQRLAGLQGQLEAEQDQLLERERDAEQTIARAERLRERVEALQEDFERLRERSAELQFKTEYPQDQEDSKAPPRPDQT